MKRKSTLLTLLLALCLLLSSCSRSGNTNANISPTPEKPDAPITTPDKEEPPQQPEEEPISISHLTAELVVEMGDAERFLSRLGELSTLLQQGLTQENCHVDDVTITISTAGGVTGDALAGGGVDVAFLPAVDYVTYEGSALAVLTTDEEICSMVVAVSAAREELDGAFCRALEKALLETTEGSDFLELYQPGITCIPATEEAIQAVRDWLAEQKSAEQEGQ